jgi:hypothetical protein
MGKPIVIHWVLALAVLGFAAVPAGAQTVRVLVPRAAIRSAPSAQGKILATALRDEFLEVAEDEGSGWLLVRIPRSTNVGFIESRSVVAVARRQPSTPPQVTSEAAPLPIRRGQLSTATPRRWPEVTLLISAAYAPQKVGFSESTKFTLYQDNTGTLDTRYEYKPAPGLDGALRVALTPWLALQAGYESASRDGSLASTAQIPHPLVFGRNRSVAQDATALVQSERGFHLSLAFTRRAGRARLAAFAGPSFVSVKTDVLERLVFSQKYPFDSADVTVKDSAPLRLSSSPTGYHLGASADLALQRHVGLGVSVRYSAAKVELARPAPSNTGVQDASGDQSIYPAPATPPKVNLGGFRLGVGARLYF